MPVYSTLAPVAPTRWWRLTAGLLGLGLVAALLAAWMSHQHLQMAQAEQAFWQQRLQDLEALARRPAVAAAKPLVVDAQALTRHWLEGAQRLQLQVLSTQLGEAGQGPLALEGRISLRGRYPAIKDLMLELAARQPGLLWRGVRLRRAAAPEDQLVEAELGFALRRELPVLAVAGAH